jgi:DNA-binding transcriptional regulator YhcF (GntR family)
VPRKRTDSERDVIMQPPFSCIVVDPNDGTSVCNQIQRHIRYLVAIGAMRDDERLPTVAELAERIGCASTLVSLAYEGLKAEGVITGVVGHGSYIAEGARSDDLVRAVASTNFSPVIGTAKTLGCNRGDIEKIVAEQLEAWYPSARRKRSRRAAKK